MNRYEDAVFALDDWREEFDLPLTADTVDEFLSTHREWVYARDHLFTYVDEFGEVEA